MYALLEDTKYLILTTLIRQPQLSALSLSLLVHMSPEQVTRALALLEQQGYVHATPGGIDIQSASITTAVYSVVERRRFNVALILENMRRLYRPENSAFAEIRNIIARDVARFFAHSGMLDEDQLKALRELIAIARRTERSDVQYEVGAYYAALEDCVMLLECTDIVLAFGKLRHAYRMFLMADPEFASFIQFVITGIEMVIISVYGQGGTYATNITV